MVVVVYKLVKCAIKINNYHMQKLDQTFLVTPFSRHLVHLESVVYIYGIGHTTIDPI